MKFSVDTAERAAINRLAASVRQLFPHPLTDKGLAAFRADGATSDQTIA